MFLFFWVPGVCKRGIFRAFGIAVKEMNRTGNGSEERFAVFRRRERDIFGGTGQSLSHVS